MIDIQYFKDRVNIDSNGCWNWNLSKDYNGYGKCSMNLEGKKKCYRVHRLLYRSYYGEIEDKSLCVCHKCDNPSCCNPEHLFLGTQKDNMDDKIKKGRQVGPFPQHGNNYTGKEVIIEGRTFKSYKEAGRFYGISDNGIRKRLKNKFLWSSG